MNLFDHFNWLIFLQNAIWYIGVGVTTSLGIFLNVKVQNKFVDDSSFVSNFLQFIAYLFSLGAAFFLIGYILLVFLHGQRTSLIENLFYFLIALFPVVVAFRSGFIPENKKRSQLKEK